jgi:hypothetical protein
VVKRGEVIPKPKAIRVLKWPQSTRGVCGQGVIGPNSTRFYGHDLESLHQWTDGSRNALLFSDVTILADDVALIHSAWISSILWIWAGR